MTGSEGVCEKFRGWRGGVYVSNNIERERNSILENIMEGLLVWGREGEVGKGANYRRATVGGIKMVSGMGLVYE